MEEVLSGSTSSSGIDVPQQIETVGSPTYPPLAKTILVALALYIAVFLVSLVSLESHNLYPLNNLLYNRACAGPLDRGYGNSEDHRSFP